MPDKRGVLLVNPRAGSFSASDAAEMQRRAGEAGFEIISVTPATDVPAIIRSELAGGVRHFIVAGGDGSIHHAAQALVGTDGVLSIIPIGTVNHTARDLQIPLDWPEAMDVALNGHVKQIDTGRINDISFLNSVMVGIYPTITHYREEFRSTHSKWRAYARSLRLAMRQFRHVSLVVELDGRVETIRTQLFVIAINSYDLTHAGIVALKTALDDGRLTVYSFGFMSRLQFVRAAAKFFRGRLEQVEGFRRIRTGRLRVDSARPALRLSIDGEVRDLPPPFVITAVPASLLVRVPRPAGR